MTWWHPGREKNLKHNVHRVTRSKAIKNMTETFYCEEHIEPYVLINICKDRIFITDARVFKTEVRECWIFIVNLMSEAFSLKLFFFQLLNNARQSVGQLQHLCSYNKMSSIKIWCVYRLIIKHHVCEHLND